MKSAYFPRHQKRVGLIIKSKKLEDKSYYSIKPGRGKCVEGEEGPENMVIRMQNLYYLR